MQSIFKYKVPIHLAGWTIFFTIPFLLTPIHDFTAILRTPSNIISMVFRNMFWVSLFYLNLLYLTPVLLKKTGVGIFLLTLFAGIIIVTIINSRIHHFFSPGPNPDFQPGPEPPPDFRGGPPGPRPLDFVPFGPFFSNLLISLMIASVSTSLVLWGDWAKARVDEQERALQKIASELAVLKLQISPHFLFNTLNNIRWLVRSKSGQAEEAVVKLSQLLRYILHQTNSEEVSLESELAHLRDYIALQQIRLSNDQSFDFVTDGDPSGKMIAPLLFIPIVENVFKHGDFAVGFQNKIYVSVISDRIVIKTVNRILKKQQEIDPEASGIGLSNVKKRLSLHYPDKHTLQYNEENEVFALSLEIIVS